MRILVTGVAGFIGSHTCLSLLKKGYEVVIIDSFVNGHKKAIERVTEIMKRNNKNININIDIVNLDIRNDF